MAGDPVAFLTARLGEDEAVAKAAQEVAPTDTELAQQAGPCVSDPTYLHIERHGPARVLREVEAKRKILARYADQPANLGDQLQRHQEQMGLLYALEQLAAIYSDHPDYDPAWAA